MSDCYSILLYFSLSSGLVVHKTFHRYTVRAKRGTAQSVRDAQGGGHGPKYGIHITQTHNYASVHHFIKSPSQELLNAYFSFCKKQLPMAYLFALPHTLTHTHTNTHTYAGQLGPV